MSSTKKKLYAAGIVVGLYVAFTVAFKYLDNKESISKFFQYIGLSKNVTHYENSSWKGRSIKAPMPRPNRQGTGIDTTVANSDSGNIEAHIENQLENLL